MLVRPAPCEAPTGEASGTRHRSANTRWLRAVAVVLALAVAAPVRTARAANLTAAMQAVEASLLQLGAAAQNAINDTQCAPASCVDACTVPACAESFPASKGFQCLGGFGNNSALCGCAGGLVRSMNESTLIVPPDHNFNDTASQRFVCATKQLDVEFRARRASGELTGWQYVADAHGVLRVYPGTPQFRGSGVCSTFDVRRRPWFVSAVTGPKNIVVVIDTSGSMGTTDSTANSNGDNLSRMQLVKNAVNVLLASFTQDDNINVVAFSSTAVTLFGGDRLYPGNVSTVSALIAATSAVQAVGGTRFDPAFTKAFRLLSAADSACTNIILFLTDGHAADDPTTALMQGQASLPAGKKAHVFTYSMSSGADQSLPKRIACAHNGVWNHINNGDDPLKKMAQYYRFLATRALSANAVRWTAPYQDEFGLGWAITASRVLLETRAGASVPVVAGVAATDLLLSNVLGGEAATVAAVEAELARRSAQCPSGTVTACDLQRLRADGSETCPAANASTTTAAVPVAASCAPSPSAASCPQLSRGLNTALCAPLLPTTRLPVAATNYSAAEVMCCPVPVDVPQNTSVTDPVQCRAGATGGLFDAALDAATASLPFTFDTNCSAAVACERTACTCLGGVYDAANTGTRCTLAAFAASSNGSCTVVSSCAAAHVTCLRGLWRSYVNGAAASTCSRWGQKVQLRLLYDAVGNATAAPNVSSSSAASAAASVASLSVNALCQDVACALGRAVNRSCVQSQCVLGCQLFALPPATPTPAPGLLGPGGVGVGSTGGSSGFSSTAPGSPAVLLAVAVAALIAVL